LSADRGRNAERVRPDAGDFGGFSAWTTTRSWDGMDDDARLGWRVVGWAPPAPPSEAPMQGRLVRLERLSAAVHGPALFAANRENDAIWDFLPYGPFATEAAYLAWVRSVEGSRDPLFFALVEAAGGKALGVASWLRIAPEAGSIEVGHINLSPALQRHPAATEAMVLMKRRAFAQGYRRYEWKCNALNIGSRRAAERLGLSFEGIFRQATVVKGRNRDTAWFAATDRDWPALSAAFATWLDPANFDAGGRQKRRLSDLTRPLLVSRDPAL
jgi:RimJ/RimL family protein N-acetyltransferase